MARPSARGKIIKGPALCEGNALKDPAFCEGNNIIVASATRRIWPSSNMAQPSVRARIHEITSVFYYPLQLINTPYFLLWVGHSNHSSYDPILLLWAGHLVHSFCDPILLSWAGLSTHSYDPILLLWAGHSTHSFCVAPSFCHGRTFNPQLCPPPSVVDGTFKPQLRNTCLLAVVNS